MAKKKRNGRYFLRNQNILPEMIVTPRRVDYVKDEVGNPAVTVGALGDIDPTIPIYVNNKVQTRGLPDMRRFRTQPTNKEAGRYADYHAAKTAPTIGDLVMGGIGKPMNLISPTHWVGAIRDWDSSKGWGNIWEDNSGLLTKEYAEKHPWQALIANGIGDAIIGGGINTTFKGAKNAIRIGKNIKNRNLFSYKYIDPAGYDNIVERMKPWVKGILKDPSFKKGEIPIPIRNPKAQVNSTRTFNNNKHFETFRDEAFRKYLQLPSVEDLYLSNGDGTWRYNKEAVERIMKRNGELRNTLEPLDAATGLLPNELMPYEAADFITSNGGNLTIIPKYRKNVNKYITEHVDELYDPWDINPYSNHQHIIDDSFSKAIADILRKQADKIYTKYYDKLYKNKFGYNYLGGKQLNKFRYGFDFNNYPKLKKRLDKFGAKLEAGFILGGKPFVMRTPIKYYTYKGNSTPLDFTYKNGGLIHPIIRKKVLNKMGGV